MAFVEEDLVEGAGFLRNHEGSVLVRRFHVNAIEISNDWPAPEVLLKASELLPKYGDALGSKGDAKNFICEQVRVFPFLNSKTQVRGEAVYRDVMSWKITIRSNLYATNTSFDKDGTVLRVLYKPGGSTGEPSPSEADAQLAEAQILRPQIVVDFEQFSRTPPFEEAEGLLGKVNSAPFQNRPARSWLCIGCEGSRLRTANQDTALWHKRFSFQFQGFDKKTRIDGFDPVLFWRDPHTRIQPTDIAPKEDGYPRNTAGNGWRLAQLYLEEDFNRLRFPTIFK